MVFNTTVKILSLIYGSEIKNGEGNWSAHIKTGTLDLTKWELYLGGDTGENHFRLLGEWDPCFYNGVFGNRMV